jgi:hypothetical protein
MQTKHFKDFLIFFCFFLLTGCSYLEFIFGAFEENKEPYSEADMRKLFIKNHDVLKKLIATCEQTPKLRRVRLEGDTEGFDTNENSEIIIKIREEMESAQLIGLHCERLYNFVDNPLAGVSFILFASGLSVSGVSQGIYYETDKMRELFPSTNNDMFSEYEPLNIKGWSLYIIK